MMDLVNVKLSDPLLKVELLYTCRGTDRYYATGLPFTSKDMYSPKKWTGLNNWVSFYTRLENKLNLNHKCISIYLCIYMYILFTHNII